jgi:hypothetical protein
MSYGHAERTLATIRLLEAETIDLLSSQDHLHPEQERWLREAAESASGASRPPARLALQAGPRRGCAQVNPATSERPGTEPGFP